MSGEPWGADDGARAGEVNAFVVIDPDNSITLRVAKSEMGQGVMTSLAMIVAEELECDFSKVKVEYASAHRNLIEHAYPEMGTGGSSSVRNSRVVLQQAGASARARLVAAAAAQWGVAPAACVASAGSVRARRLRPFCDLRRTRRRGCEDLADGASRRSRRPTSSSSSERASRGSIRRSR